MSQTEVPFRAAVRAWFLVSLQTFGGPAGQIAVMQHAFVDTRRWIGQRRFLHALNYCMLLPGPEAQQLAIYLGWLLHGTRGGLVAGVLFVLPGAVSLFVLSAIYVAAGETAWVAAVFSGLAPAVLAIVAHAVWRVGRRALTQPALVAVAGAAFVCLAVFAIPFPVVIAGGAVIGWLVCRRIPAHDEDFDPPRTHRPIRILAIGLVLWFVPVALVALLTGPHSVLTTQGTFFSWTAVITFGGAYAVLAYVAEEVVNSHGWLSEAEMVRGVALAETTPGPLIMVLQFVAFVAAYRHPGDLNPWVAASLGAALTTWVTFVPCFLFVLIGAPYAERLRGNASLNAALAGITAAVVGVIASLAVFFARHTLVTPSAVVIAVVAAGLLWWRRWSVPRVLVVCAVLGALLTGLGRVDGMPFR